MNCPKTEICVGICTFQRPAMIARLLHALEQQVTSGAFKFRVVVVDNDLKESARAVVEAFAKKSAISVQYYVEPTPNIALARNLVVAKSEADYLAFIDDDEFPTDGWLRTMLESCARDDVAGVLGPVLPHFENSPPWWLKRGGFYDRPRHKTGFVLGWQECRTGNVLLKYSVVKGMSEVFRPQFGTGGEDQDFFRRLVSTGHKFIWCDEGVVFETVPPHRWKLQFLLRRALLRGRISASHPKHRLRNLMKAMVAVPTYTAALPILGIFAPGLFMRYFVRLFDHVGRILAFCRLNPVSVREQ